MLLLSSMASAQEPFYKQKKYWAGKAVYYFWVYKDAQSTKEGMKLGACERTKFLQGPDGCSFNERRYWLTNAALDMAFSPFDTKYGWLTFGFRLGVGGLHARSTFRNNGINERLRMRQ
jgi:hypothetical protein